MATRDYNLNYTSDNSDALTKTQQFIAALQALLGWVSQVKAAVAGMFQGFGSNAQQATGAIQLFNGAGQNANTTYQQTNNTLNQTQVILQQFNTQVNNATANGGSFTRSLIEMRAAMFALHEIREVMRAIADGLKEARDFSQETAEANLKLLDSLRELSALRGKTGPDNQDSAAAVGLMLEAGFKDPQDARKFQQFFEGAIPVAETKGNLAPTKGTPEDLKRDITRSAARLSVAKGVDPETAAKLAASVATTKKVTDVQQVEAELQLMIENLNAAPDEVSPLARQVLGVRGSLIQQGYAASLPDVASLITAVNINNPAGRSGTRLESMVNEITKTVGKQEDEGALAKIGITRRNRDLADIFHKLRIEIQEANKPGGIGGQGRLRQLGFTNSRAMTEFVKATAELDFLDAQMAHNKQVLENPAGVTAKAGELNQGLDAFRAGDQTGRFAGAEMEAAKFLRGIQGQDLRNLRTSAAAKLTADNKIKTPWVEIQKKLEEFDPASGVRKDRESSLVDQLVAQRLIAQARAKGFSDEKIKKIAPDIFAASEIGGRGAILGEDRLALNVAELKSQIEGKGHSAAIRDVSRRQQGLGIAERVRRLANPPNPRAVLPGGAAGGGGGAGAAGAIAGPGPNQMNPHVGRQLDQLVNLAQQEIDLLMNARAIPQPGGGAAPGRH